MKNEPVLTAASIAGVVSAVLALAIAFGVDISESQTAAILGVVGTVAPIVLAFVARAKVTPTAKLDGSTD